MLKGLRRQASPTKIGRSTVKAGNALEGLQTLRDGPKDLADGHCSQMFLSATLASLSALAVRLKG
jgi:hypothetical protein